MLVSASWIELRLLPTYESTVENTTCLFVCLFVSCYACLFACFFLHMWLLFVSRLGVGRAAVWCSVLPWYLALVVNLQWNIRCRLMISRTNRQNVAWSQLARLTSRTCVLSNVAQGRSQFHTETHATSDYGVWTFGRQDVWATDVWATIFFGDDHVGDTGWTFGRQKLDVWATVVETFRRQKWSERLR